MLNCKNKANTILESKTAETASKHTGTIQKIILIFISCLMALPLVAPTMVRAEGEAPATSVVDDDLEIGPELIGQPVRAVKNPTVNPVSIGDKTVSGQITVGAGQRKAKRLDVIIHVTVDRLTGSNEVKTVNIPYNAKSSWEVTLASELVEGDKVTVQQEFDGEISESVVLEVKKTLADQHKADLKMPSGKIWIENPDANLVNDDEQAEAIEMLKKANPNIAKDFDPKKTKFSIDGTDHAYYEVTYTDGSTSGKIEATELKIKKVEDTSAAPTIGKVQVTDGQIIVTLDREVAQGTKFYFVKEFRDGEDKNFCQDGSCKVDKSVGGKDPVKVIVNGTTVTFPIKDKVDDLKLGRAFGIAVKEPHKFRSCAKSEPVITSPDKVAVRDPHKLTDDDKKAIDKAIRDANTVNGVSKLPDGTGSNVGGAPTIIDFDKDGNVTIISPNDVVVNDWDSNGNPIYTKNPDGTYKLKSGSENNVTKFPAKDLVKNIAPKSPAIAVDTDKGEVTITPPAYEKAGDDTDLASYTITYKDASDVEKTIKLTRTVDATTGKTTWTSDGATVDANTGVVTLQIKDLAVGATITATAKDKGGLEGDTEELESAPASKALETVEVTYDGNGGTGKMDGKKLNKGSKYKILDNAFTAPANEKFKTWKIGDTEYAADVEITVKENTTIKAIWQDIEVTVSYSPNGGSGEMTGKTMKKGSKYTLLESTFNAPDDTQEFKAWEVDGKEVAAGTEITVDKDTEVKAVWKKIQVNVTYDGNGGGGSMDGATVDKGSEYTVLPNAFTAPDDTQEFKAWEVDGKEVAPGTKITVKDNTVVKAIWKKIQVKVTYDANGGSETMTGATVDKGSKYTVLPNGFKAPDDTQEFDIWEIDGNRVDPGTEITVTKDTVVKALWKKIPVNVTYDANGGNGTMTGATVDKGSNYTVLPNAFTAPNENQEFDTWEVNGTKVAPGTKIKADKDTVIKAIWKKIPVKVTYDGNGGKGTMDGKSLFKGDTYKLLASTFTAPKNKEFDTWEVDGKKVAPGTEITVDKDTVIKAIWKAKPAGDKDKPTQPGGKGKPTKPTQPGGKDKSDLPGNQNNKKLPRPQGGPAQPKQAGKPLPKTGETGMFSIQVPAILLAVGGMLTLARKRKKD